MGARLVGALVAKHPDLSDRAFRVAVRMALSALDEPRDGRPAHLYFNGWEVLALALGRDLPPAGSADPAERHRRRLASESVRRAVQELVARGLVEPLGTAHRGSRQAYRLHFGIPSAPPEDTGPASSSDQTAALSPSTDNHTHSP